jgi:hypothetical protein
MSFMATTNEQSPALIEVTNLREFFRDSVQTALHEQHVTIDQHTEHYVVNVLTMFARTEDLYESTADGPRLRPLAQMLADAMAASEPVQRQQALRRLGDVSLFVAGFFAQSFARKLIDIDYHIAMGGRAYSALAGGVTGPLRVKALGAIFKFHRVVDVLNDVAEMAHTHTDKDILRLYEVWLKTGSPRARNLLQRLGVAPTPVVIAGFRH